jgi:hypothetical protein
MFCLKQYDIPLLTFEIIEDSIDGQQCRIHHINSETENLLPLGMKRDNAGLMAWLRGRIIPKNRAFVNSFLAKSVLSHDDTRGILRVCRGLSLNDSYWVVEDDFAGTFAEYNLYEHDFVTVLSLIAYTGYGNSRARGFSSSPEFTTSGMLRKGWRRIGGKILLYKGGTSGAANTGNEPYSEFYAAQVAEAMGIHHVPYGLSSWQKCICSTCELFCDIDHSFVPIYRLVDNCSLRTAATYCKQFSEEVYNQFVDMLVFDALIFNEDRHFGNFGMMVDNKNDEPYAFAPLFDHGLSLFNYAMPDDLEDLPAYAKTRSSAYGVPFDNIVREFITPRQKEMLRKMIGFTFTRDRNYNWPAKRQKTIEKYLQTRAGELIETPVK